MKKSACLKPGLSGANIGKIFHPKNRKNLNWASLPIESLDVWKVSNFVPFPLNFIFFRLALSDFLDSCGSESRELFMMYAKSQTKYSYEN